MFSDFRFFALYVLCLATGMPIHTPASVNIVALSATLLSLKLVYKPKVLDLGLCRISKSMGVHYCNLARYIKVVSSVGIFDMKDTSPNKR